MCKNLPSLPTEQCFACASDVGPYVSSAFFSDDGRYLTSDTELRSQTQILRRGSHGLPPSSSSPGVSRLTSTRTHPFFFFLKNTSGHDT